ncbi:MAG TPA: M56 family metallopeptidase [Candidatus Dormibacteraeota bacterium]
MLARPDIRARSVFSVALALGVGGLSAVVAAILTAAASVHHGSTGAGHILLGQARLTYPTANGAALLLLAVGAFGAFEIAAVARASWRQLRGYRRLRAALAHPTPLDGDPSVRVIPDSLPQAFCAGYLRPGIYVSQRAVELLTEPELGAVLAHEHHHRRARDPLRLAAGQILGEALVFLPGPGPLSERYADLAELRADQAAVRASDGNSAPLASALLVFDENGPPGVSGISPERVDSLLGEFASPRVPLLLLAGSVAALAALAAAIWSLSPVASAHATFNLPLLSSAPCVTVPGMLVIAACVSVARRKMRRRSRFKRVWSHWG